MTVAGNKYVRKFFLVVKQNAIRFSLPGFHKVPIYDVTMFYKKGIVNGTIGVRASAISFNFFLAIFPSIIFIFSLIPFIPIHNFQNELILLIKQVLPFDTYKAIEDTIIDITTKKRGSALSFGLFATLFFSTNGVASMIAALNASASVIETRSWLSTRLIGIFLAFILFLLVSLATGLIIFNRDVIGLLLEHHFIHNGLSQSLIVIGKWSIVLLISLLGISSVYYYAPSKRSEYRFFSPGSIMATFLMIISTLLFSYYVGHFGRYNALYGSIGTLIALLIWLNINSFVLLIGFELNMSIRHAEMSREDELMFSDSIEEYGKFYPKKEDLLKDYY